MSPQLVEIIIKLHIIFDDYHKVSSWLKTPNLSLGGSSPFKLIERGRGHKVLGFIDEAYAAGEL